MTPAMRIDHRSFASRSALVTLGALIAALLCGVPTGVSSPAHPCVQKDELWFRAADGTRLVGHRFGGRRPGRRTAIVLAHMSEGDLCSWAPYARRLAAKGFFVFPFDFRGHGFSEGRQDHRKATVDLVAAVRAVRALGARRVVAGGASLGGIAAIVAAPTIRPPLHGVVSVSGPAAISGQLDARPVVPRLRVPTLYVVAEQDQNEPYDFAAEAQELHDATGTGEKRIELVPGSEHGTFLVDRSLRVRRALERFFRNPAAAVP
jgi:pimeloyl-ACP methyl ester carboxylesterase